MAEEREVIIKLKIDDQGYVKSLDEAVDATEELDESTEELSGSIAGAADNFSLFGVSVGSLKKGLAAIKTSFTTTAGASKLLGTAMKAIPILALIGGITALIGFFTKTQKGIEALRKITAGFEAGLDVLIDRISAVGEFLFEAFSNPKEVLADLAIFVKDNLINRFTSLAVILEGVINLDFQQIADGVIQAGTGVENATSKMTEGFNALKEGIQGVNDEISREVDLAVELEGARIALEKGDDILLVKNAQRQQQIAELILLTRDQTVSFEIRQAAVIEGRVLEEAILADNIRQQEERIRIAEEDFERAESTQEDFRALQEERVILIQLETDSLNRQRDFKNRLTDLEKQAAAERKKQSDARKKQIDQEIKSIQQLETVSESIDKKRREREEKDSDSRIKEMLKELDFTLAVANNRIDKDAEEVEARGLGKKIDALNESEAAKIIFGIAARTAIGQKALAIKDTIIETRKGAVRAYSSLSKIPVVGPALGIIAAAAITAFGLLAVKDIAAQTFQKTFATGGKVGKGNIPRQPSGDNVLAFLRDDEVVLTTKQQAAVGGPAVFKAANVPGFQTGGLISASLGGATLSASSVSNITRVSEIVNELNEVLRSLPPPIVLVDDIRRGVGAEVAVEDFASQ